MKKEKIRSSEGNGKQDKGSGFDQMTQIHKFPNNNTVTVTLFKQAVGKMAQWLRVFTALEEELSSRTGRAQLLQLQEI